MNNMLYCVQLLLGGSHIMTDSITQLFENGNPLSMISTIAMVLMLVFVLWQAFHGFRKGIVRQGVKTGLTVVAALVAFFLTDYVTDYLFNIFGEGQMSVDQFVTTLKDSGVELEESIVAILTNINSDVFEYILSMLFGVLLAPFVMLVLFFVANLVLRIIYHIVKLIFRFPKGGNLVPRLIATGVGALHGFIVSAIILLPFITIADLADASLEATIAVAPEEEKAEITEIYENGIRPVTKNSTFVVVKALGGDLVLNELGTARGNGETFKAREEFFALISGVSADIDGLTDIKFESLTEENKAALNNVVNFVGDSDFLSTIVTGVLSGMAKSAEQGYIPLGDLEGPEGKIINAAVEVFADIKKEDLKDDLATIMEVLYILSDSGALATMSEGGDLSDLFTAKWTDENGVETTVLNAVLTKLNESHFTPLVTALTEMSIEMLLPDDVPVTAETVESIKTGFNEILKIEKPAEGDEAAKEAYKAKVSNVIDETLKDNQIELEPEIIDGIADYVANPESDTDGIIKELDPDGDGQLSDQEFNDIILKYYDAYMQNMENVPVPQT